MNSKPNFEFMRYLKVGLKETGTTGLWATFDIDNGVILQTGSALNPAKTTLVYGKSANSLFAISSATIR